MDRYAAGDDSAFKEVYDQLVPPLFAFLVRKVGEPSRAEDLVQQALLQMHVARGRFVPGSRVMPWAFAIAHRLFLDTAKRKKLELLTSDGSVPVNCPSVVPGPATLFESKEVESLLLAQLSDLSDAQREAFELVHYGQLSQAEIAEMLGVSIASVKLRLQRANEAIRRALEPMLDEHGALTRRRPDRGRERARSSGAHPPTRSNATDSRKPNDSIVPLSARAIALPTACSGSLKKMHLASAPRATEVRATATKV
jgi:RNA polymerase sigma-70 factor (ECF subfamily)